MHTDSWGGGISGCFLVVIIVVSHTWTAVAAPLSYHTMVKLTSSDGQQQSDARLPTNSVLLHRLRFRNGPGIEAERQRRTRSPTVKCMSVKKDLLLAIDPNGTVYGNNTGPDNNSRLIIESVGLTEVLIRGEVSDRYITFSPSGDITSTRVQDVTVASNMSQIQCGSSWDTTNCTHPAYPVVFQSVSPGTVGKYLAMHRSGQVISKKNPRDGGGASVYFKCY